jgi:hypothetical protein
MKYDLKWSKIISKFYRMKLSDDLKEMTESFPFIDLKEIQSDNIYLAKGGVQIGNFQSPISVRVWLDEKEPNITLISPMFSEKTLEFNQTNVSKIFREISSELLN